MMISKNYGGFSLYQRQIIISDALDFISSYFFSDSQGIGVHKVFQRSLSLNTSDMELSAFIPYIQLRFYLSKWLTFSSADLKTVDRVLTSNHDAQVTDIVGKIQGTLVVDQYVIKKWNSNIDKRFPCLVSTENYATPENAFLFRTINSLLQLIRNIRIASLSDESTVFRLRKKVLNDIENLMRHDAMSDVTASPYWKMRLSLLRDIVTNRIRRGRTGNTPFYRSLLELSEVLNVNWSSVVTHEVGDLTQALETGDTLWNKLFEIWVLHRIVQASRGVLAKENAEIGFSLIPLNDRSNGPVFTMTAPELYLEVYFQNARPLRGTWKYSESEQYLRGIPDIIISLTQKDNPDQGVIAIVDVKNITYRGRTDGNEEKYKMLGYFDHFKYSLGTTPLGFLMFRNDQSFKADILTSDIGGSLNIYTTDMENNDPFVHIINNVLRHFSSSAKESKLGITPINDALIHERSEVAHVMAKELAITNPGQLRQCKDDLSRFVFPTKWNWIPSESQTLLAMAELLFKHLESVAEEDPDVDWGPTVLEYCRSLEHFLNFELIEKFKTSPFFPHGQGEKHKFSDTYEYIRRSNRALTLGEIVRFFGDLKSETGGIIDFFQRTHPTETNQLYWTTILVSSLSQLNSKYRRKAAHITLLQRRDVIACRSLILGSGEQQGIFPRVLTEMYGT